MSTPPVTLMVARRVAEGRYEDLIAWLREGEQLATDFPGYLGSGVLAPPPNDDEFQIIFRFADEKTLHAWEFSASRSAWLARGNGLFQQPHEHRVSGIDGWFGPALAQRPPRWKQAVAIWLAFFPVSLAFNLLFGHWLGELGLVPRVLLSTLALTPLMVYLFIPLSTHLLASWLHPKPAPQSVAAPPVGTR
ncbi:MULTISPECIES: antibiotic biosynthesis monooxygenase [Pseudomonas]|jgi:antibiotic biosynthesis monooxygenase (ABM) superfamily enzyme|uniref:ABM domain-containing protein n=2 Tax=Pseudomonas TaxID=286 RepID=A0A9X8EIH4_PSEPU|nr:MULTISPECIES: antibiotic biosynthesis monooxygenase [Pseudomonas]KIU53604.1 antibiotic biosynthesis monooxygenase [Pseudomonas putida]KTC23212.1 antibiotic biosynthesis monooxygenase [Pseudomonas putida]MBG8559949.1 antibiotic biosynthesis monooxygenase [Pseudomonas qingdaonensis]MCO7503991.1 antibiotic biosynthesis monooxygenase [Pseudomonas sp. VE 267-6A]MCO7530725.1 antibiotic biosynthesis monooxygenase [Pseudomonas sp. 2]